MGTDVTALWPMGCAMSAEHTTAVVQHYLDQLAGDSPAEPIVWAVLDRAVPRLHLLCATLLHRSYPRLTQPPLDVQADELLGAVEERLHMALLEARPRTVRQLIALANQHMRRELNDLARRLDDQPAAVSLSEGLVLSPASSASGLTPDGRSLLRAIGELPEDEREVFDLVRIQGMTQTEVAAVQPPLHRHRRDAEQLGGLRLRHSLDAHQVEDLPLVLRQLVDRAEHAKAVRSEAGGAAGGRGHEPLAQLHGGGLII